jgi:hypothetical protein
MGLPASREFDEKMADMRRQYARLSPEGKDKLRRCLEDLSSPAKEMLECGFLVRVQQEIDFEDDEGNRIFATVEYDPNVLLQAVKAWDAGEDFAPGNATTIYG